MRYDESRDKVTQKELKKARGSYNKFSEMTKALWEKVSGNSSQLENIKPSAVDVGLYLQVNSELGFDFVSLEGMSVDTEELSILLEEYIANNSINIEGDE